jgi:hypothetical protein
VPKSISVLPDLLSDSGELDNVYVIYDAGDALNGPDYVTIGAHTSYSAMRALFANPLVKFVEVETDTTFTDQFGKSRVDTATWAALRRPTEQLFNWEGLTSRVYADNKALFCIMDGYRIAPSVYQSLDDKGCMGQWGNTKSVLP